jgi:hypothetical protein
VARGRLPITERIGAVVGAEGVIPMVTVAILGGFSSVILVMLMGQSRVFYRVRRCVRDNRSRPSL